MYKVYLKYPHKMVLRYRLLADMPTEEMARHVIADMEAEFPATYWKTHTMYIEKDFVPIFKKS